MDLSEKNGQPSMEEILASIRRIIAEEPTAANPVIDLHAKYKAKGGDHDEGNDFELPSIFRPNTQATPERQPLFGRLTDAIRNASGSANDSKARNGSNGHEPADPNERYRGTLRDSSGAVLAVNSDAAGGTGDSERYRGALRDAGVGGGASSLTTALSSLKLTRGEAQLGERKAETPVAPAPSAVPLAAAAPPTVAPVAQAVSEPAEDVRRVMVPFRDMRMSKMSTATPEAAPMIASPALESLMAPPHVATAPSTELPPTGPTSNPYYPQPDGPAPTGAASFDSMSLEDMHRFAPVVENPYRAAPPPVPHVAQPVASEAGGGIEDTTADLLRPMLRQWLSENMPRMVEKALSIELAESVRVNRKPGG